MDETGAAFGFFPQLKPRRSINTDTTSLPLDVLRGRLAGLLGAPADILNLLQSPMPTEMMGEWNYEPAQQLPYGSEYFLKTLPLEPTSPAGQLAGKAASFVPLNPMPAVRGVQKVGRMVGEEIDKAMLGEGGLLGNIVPKPSFMVSPETGLLPPPKPQVSDIGFYSAVEDAGLNLQRKQGAGQAFLNDILKGANVKSDEVKWMGLDDFLASKKNMTKQEVQDFIAANKVDVKEVELNNEASAALAKSKSNVEADRVIMEMTLPNLSILDKANLTSFWAGEAARGDKTSIAKIQALNLDDNAMKAVMSYGEAVNRYSDLYESSKVAKSPKFGQYTLPGGENYREILLTMPEKQTPIVSPDTSKWTVITKQTSPSGARQVQVRDDQGNMVGQRFGFQGSDKDAIQEVLPGFLESRSKVKQNESNYRSSHWDQPNVLAHMRVNDRVDADGKKMLLIEEVQSDWHQAGRTKGYGPKTETTVEAYYETKSGQRIPIGFGKTKEEAEASIDVGWKNMVDIKYDTQTRKVGEGVPDAPFKDTWYQLALKRALKYAADNGYDRVGLTTGARQAERYDLSKQVDELNYKRNDDGTYRLSAQSNGRGNMLGESIPEKNLSDYVGKEVAEKIAKNEGFDRNFGGIGSVSQPKDIWKGLSGIDLKIGGEGMKKYYDEVYPKFLDKYGKKWGAKVGETKINLHGDLEGYMPRHEMEYEPIRYIDITPEMRKSVGKGQPLFTTAPAIAVPSLLDSQNEDWLGF